MEIASNKGGRKFAHDGYLYDFDKPSADGETLFWRCKEKGRCKARIHTKNGDVVNTFGAHSHDSDPARIAAKQALLKMKTRAAQTDQDISELISATLEDLPESVAKVMPTQSSLRKVIQRVRNQREDSSNAPVKLICLVDPTPIARTSGTVVSDDRHLVPTKTMEMVSSRGRRKFVHEGYSYDFDKCSVDGNTFFWRCELKGRCKARIHTTAENAVINTVNYHSHDSDPAKVRAKEAILDLKARAAQSLEEASQVIESTLQDLPDCVVGAMPTRSSLRKIIRRVRNQQAPIAVHDSTPLPNLNYPGAPFVRKQTARKSTGCRRPVKETSAL